MASGIHLRTAAAGFCAFFAAHRLNKPVQELERRTKEKIQQAQKHKARMVKRPHGEAKGGVTLVTLRETAQLVHGRAVVYVLACSRQDRKLTYLGSTSAVRRRWREHASATGKSGAARVRAQVKAGHKWRPMLLVVCPTLSTARGVERYAKVKYQKHWPPEIKMHARSLDSACVPQPRGDDLNAAGGPDDDGLPARTRRKLSRSVENPGDTDEPDEGAAPARLPAARPRVPKLHPAVRRVLGAASLPILQSALALLDDQTLQLVWFRPPGEDATCLDRHAHAGSVSASFVCTDPVGDIADVVRMCAALDGEARSVAKRPRRPTEE